MGNILILCYVITFLFYFLAFGFCILRKKILENIVALLGLLANAACLIIIVMRSRHAPVYRLFESMMLGALILSVLGFLSIRQDEKNPNLRFWVWLEILLILGITAFAGKEPSPFGYDYNNLYIIMFHALRIVVVSLTLFSSALYIQSRFDNRHNNSLAIYHAHLGRNFLILGAVLFLMAEYIGIDWCLRGWGDFWQWGAGFFQSTLVVIFFMLAIHIPGSNHRSGSWRPRLGIFCGFLILVLTAIRSTL
jgi:hypothetical protein